MSALDDPRPETRGPRKGPEEMPAATVRKRKWAFPVIWVVPLVATLVAAYLVFGRLQELGPMITIRFSDASGITAAQTDVEYRGVPIGQVKRLQLSADGRSVLVRARLTRSAAKLAREGSEFWIVRLQNGSLTNLGAEFGTVFSGPYIAILPGTGQAKTEFAGLDQPPVVQERGALHVVLHTGNAGSIRPGTPILYRGIEVGAVQDLQFNSAANAVELHVEIKPQYARLVRSNSRFRDVSGVNVHFGLLKGLQVNVQSLRTLVTGAIAFSSPESPKGAPARDAMEFQLDSGVARVSSNAHRFHLFGRDNRG